MIEILGNLAASVLVVPPTAAVATAGNEIRLDSRGEGGVPNWAGQWAGWWHSCNHAVLLLLGTLLSVILGLGVAFHDFSCQSTQPTADDYLFLYELPTKPRKAVFVSQGS